MASRAEEIYNRMAGIKSTARAVSDTASVPAQIRAHQANHDAAVADYDGDGDDRSEDETEERMDESRGPLEESGATHDESSEEEEVEDGVAQDILRFEQSFKNITQRYRLINRIGEGTFSTVYKAEDLLYDRYTNDWNLEEKDGSWFSPQAKNGRSKGRFVAIKKIYVTSSPMRIFNELELLHDLRGSDHVCPLITAFRHQDQVIAVLPYFQHRDFRDYFREMTVIEMRPYFHSLFTAVAAVHEHQIIHRDIKPTNFLYSPGNRRGVLVDFGLAEREGTDWHACNCSHQPEERTHRIRHSLYNSIRLQYRENGQAQPAPTYPRDDTRHSRRANRAGTRGFRAPEVLLKCTAQTCVLDVWSCGVILLTLLSRRFPFFHSADDIDAFIELCTIFGKRRMNEVALLHGQVLQTNLPTISENGHSWEKILLWCTNRSKKDGLGLDRDELEAVEFMSLCLELDPVKRITAEEALQHPFITGHRSARDASFTSVNDADVFSSRRTASMEHR